jgi:hypothetical protein
VKSRRKFILDGSIFMAALAAAPASSFGLPVFSREGPVSLQNVSHRELAALIGTIFRVRLSSGAAVDLKLLKAPLAPPTPVLAGHPLPGDAGYEKFSLIFNGPKNHLIQSAIHHFEHEELGRFEMYVGQIGTMDDDVRYEAGFNRPAPVVS